MLDEEEQQEEQKEPEQVPEQPLNQLAKAKYDFTASTPRELTFKKVQKYKYLLLSSSYY